MDFAGLFEGVVFFVRVDASKWPEVRVMTSTTFQTLDVLREWFVYHWLPEHLVMDNAPQFGSAEFETVMIASDIKHVKCAPCHQL